MKYCPKCGKFVYDNVNFCGECGTPVGDNVSSSNPYNSNSFNQPQESSTLAVCSIVMGFLWPILGFILGIIGCIKCQTPKNKKMCIAGIVIAVVNWIISFILLSVMTKYFVDLSVFGL